MELSHKKALRMLNECPDTLKLTNIEPIFLNRVDFNGKNFSRLEDGYKSLEEAGIVTIDRKGKVPRVKLTEKGSGFVLSRKELSKYGKHLSRISSLTGSGVQYVITSHRSMENVLEIQEIPQLNIAKVSVELDAQNKTPFYFLEEAEEKQTLKKSFQFRKTTEGWKYCVAD